MIRSIPTQTTKSTFLAALCCTFLLLAGCGGGGGGGEPGQGQIGGPGGIEGGGDLPPTSLNQAGFNGSTYQFGHDSIPNITFTGAPADTDFSRWAMLHDGRTYRLYFWRASGSSIYQFGFNPSTSTYEFGYDSIPEIGITGIPADADTSSFKMLHDGANYRLYLRGFDRTKLYQFAFDGSTYAFGYRSISVLNTDGAPADADFDRWAMLHDGTTYRQYIGKLGTEDQIYQFGFNGRSYLFGYNSISVLSITGMPESSETESFSMLHDGRTYRFYHLWV
jgi:hypothetical protein